MPVEAADRWLHGIRRLLLLSSLGSCPSLCSAGHSSWSGQLGSASSLIPVWCSPSFPSLSTAPAPTPPSPSSSNSTSSAATATLKVSSSVGCTGRNTGGGSMYVLWMQITKSRIQHCRTTVDHITCMCGWYYEGALLSLPHYNRMTGSPPVAVLPLLME